MQVTFKNDSEKMQFAHYLEKFEIDSDLPAYDLLCIFQAYEKAIKDSQKINERLAKAITYTSVALSTLEGK